MAGNEGHFRTKFPYWGTSGLRRWHFRGGGNFSRVPVALVFFCCCFFFTPEDAHFVAPKSQSPVLASLELNEGRDAESHLGAKVALKVAVLS